MSTHVPAEWPPVRWVETPEELAAAMKRWREAGVIGVDTEANSFHAYHERLCLLQVTAGEEDWLVDPIALGDDLQAIGPLLADPEVTKIFHAAEYDLMMLKKELGAQVRGLFDTQVAMTLLGHERTGLAALIESYYGVELSKKEQRSDWGRRPLRQEQIDYARVDTHFLPDLHERLCRELEEADMVAAAQGEFERQERDVLEPTPPDPNRWRKLKGARNLDPEGLARLRALFEWREQEAERRDVPLFRVLSNHALVALAQDPPRNVKQLAGVRGMGWKLAKRYGDRILEVLGEAQGERVEPSRRKTSPAERERRRVQRENLDLLRNWRKERAREMELPSERLLHRRQLEEIARRLPRTREDLLATVQLSDWQREHLEDSLLQTLERLPDPDPA